MKYSALQVPAEFRSAFGFPLKASVAVYKQLQSDVIHVITYRGTERSAAVEAAGAEPCRLDQWNDASGRQVWKLADAAARSWVAADEERLRAG